MATSTITLKVSIAWWLRPYCYTMATFYGLTGRTPTEAQITKWIRRGISIKAA